MRYDIYIYSLPPSFALSRALSLSPSLIFSLTHSLTHSLSRGDTSAYLAAKIANGYYMKGDDDNNINDNDNVS